MKKQSISIAIVTENRKANKEGLVPVKLRITHLRKQVFLSIRDKKGEPIWMETGVFNSLFKQRVPADLKPLKNYLIQVEQKANNIIEKHFNDTELFTFERFKDFFFDRNSNQTTNNLIEALKQKAVQLSEEGRISTAISYTNSLNSLIVFNKSDKILFSQCTPSFFKSFEKWFVSDGKSITTVGIYMRNVRAIFNENIKNGNIPPEAYPFGKGKYEIPTGMNIKKAITLADVKKIMDFKFDEKSPRNFYKDLWLFSYFCNGINIKDIALLKYKDIDDAIIYVNRSKTINDNRIKPKTIQIPINTHVGRIIDTHGTKNEYVFNILTSDMTPKQVYSAIQQMVKNINKTMTFICELLDLPKITTYTARHTFATVLKRSGASVEFISESLGHKNLQTTENYLANFEIDTKRKWSNALIPE